jgi:acyl-coenzyme A synthetase/AMP-(fatty) acid ligase
MESLRSIPSAISVCNEGFELLESSILVRCKSCGQVATMLSAGAPQCPEVWQSIEHFPHECPACNVLWRTDEICSALASLVDDE